MTLEYVVLEPHSIWVSVMGIDGFILNMLIYIGCDKKCASIPALENNPTFSEARGKGEAWLTKPEQNTWWDHHTRPGLRRMYVAVRESLCSFVSISAVDTY